MSHAAVRNDDRGCTISQWRRTIERDQTAQTRPVALAFFSPESFREFLATLNDGDVVAVVGAGDDDPPAGELRFA